MVYDVTDKGCLLEHALIEIAVPRDVRSPLEVARLLRPVKRRARTDMAEAFLVDAGDNGNGSPVIEGPALGKHLEQPLFQTVFVGDDGKMVLSETAGVLFPERMRQNARNFAYQGIALLETIPLVVVLHAD